MLQISAKRGNEFPLYSKINWLKITKIEVTGNAKWNSQYRLNIENKFVLLLSTLTLM